MFSPPQRSAVLGSTAMWDASKLSKNISAGQSAKRLPMKKIISIKTESLREKAGSSRKLPKFEMEYELDHCPAPWKCPVACYRSCVECLQDKDNKWYRTKREKDSSEDEDVCPSCGSRVFLIDSSDTLVMMDGENLKTYPGDYTNRNCVKCTYPQEYEAYFKYYEPEDDRLLDRIRTHRCEEVEELDEGAEMKADLKRKYRGE